MFIYTLIYIYIYIYIPFLYQKIDCLFEGLLNKLYICLDKHSHNKQLFLCKQSIILKTNHLFIFNKYYFFKK